MADLSSTSQAPGYGARWKWALFAGIVLLLLGAAGAGAATALELTSLILFGPLLLTSSLIQLLTAFFAEKGQERLIHFAAAVLEAVLGFLLMMHPLALVTDLVVLVALFLMVVGSLRLLRSLTTHSPGRAWAVMAGAAALVLGFCIWLRLPVAGLWFVGLCIALDFICHGVCWSAVALAEKNPRLESSPAPGGLRETTKP